MTLTAPEATTATPYQWNPAPDLVITALGLPAAQGSKAYKGHRTSRATGKRIAVLVEQSKRVKPWRQAVADAAETALILKHHKQYGGHPMAGAHPLRGPIRVDVAFTMRKPASAPKRTRTYPAVSPDHDKVLRSTFDALTEAGVWEDDGRVIQINTVQCYPNEHPDALSEPGAVIRLYTLPGATQ